MKNGTSAMSFCILPERDRKLQYNKQVGMRLADLLDGTEHDAYSARMRSCANYLTYQVKQNIVTGEIKQDIQTMHTCKVRVDPVCTWARSRIWRKRLDEGLTKLVTEHSNTKFIFLTLTKQTCDVTELGNDIKALSKAFDTLMKRRDVKNNVIGYVKSMEVTRRFNWYDAKGKFLGCHGSTWVKRHKSKTKSTWKGVATNEVHPHLHILLAVKPSYFTHGYIKQSTWVKYWKESLNVSYLPVVDIRSVKPNPKFENDKLGLLPSVLELAKYSTKPCDLVHDQYFLVQFIKQIKATKHIVTGGLIRKYVNSSEPSEEDILNATENITDADDWIDLENLYFYFDASQNIYQERKAI